MTPTAAKIVTRLASLTRLGLDIDANLFGGYYSAEARPVAEAALDTLTDRTEQARRVLFHRYGIDLRYTRATEIAEMA